MSEASSPNTKATESPAPPRRTTPPDERVAASLHHCHHLTRQRARNFYYGLKLTPEPKRSALYAIYAFMREADDLIDGDHKGDVSLAQSAAMLQRLDAFRDATRLAIEGGPNDPLPPGEIWPAVRYVAQAFGVKPSRFYTMIDGQRLDATTDRYATFGDTYAYCYKVASIVGLACLDVWGHDGESGVEQLAEYRGIAFQLTNILRDVVEDARQDRVYLPQDELARFGVTLRMLRGEGEVGHDFERMMRFQIERARSYYEMSATLERHLCPECRATSWAMTQIYRCLLEKIAAQPRAVLTRRIRLSSLQKLAIAARATWRREA